MYHSRQPHHRGVSCVLILLADDEWSGSGIMEEVARQALADYPDLDCVEVYEHAGWYLIYDRKMRVVGTANDQWPGNDNSHAFWKDVWAKNYVVQIRRPVKAQRMTAELTASVRALEILGVEVLEAACA
jgi:hypothetical protein